MWPPSIKLKMLIAIAILPLLLFNTKQTSAQEADNNMPSTYGLGGYTMDEQKQPDGQDEDVEQQVMVPDDAQLLKTTEEVAKYKTNEHKDKQSKACKVELGEGNKFEVFYDEDAAKDGCTVDFVMDKIDEAAKTIKTEIKVKDTEMGCLEDCGSNEMAASSKNIVPFTYSMSNAEFMDVHDEPYNEEDQTHEDCEDQLECSGKGGKCMGTPTSLQVAWTKCAGDKVRARAWIQLVGEPISEWKAEIKDKPEEDSSEDSDEDPHEDSEGEYPDEAVIQLSIEMGDNPKHKGNNVPLFTVTGQDGIPQRFLHKLSGGDYIYPACFLNNALPMIPEPQFWTIKSGNTQINGKHLFVFHLLPQKATRVFVKNGILQNDQPPEMPKCIGKLSIIFEDVVGLLQSSELSPPPKPYTTQTTEKKTPGGTASTTSQGTELMPSEGSTNTSNATTAAVIWDAESTAGAGDDRALLIAIGAGGAVLLLVIVIFLVWCLCCRNKKKRKQNKDAEIGKKTRNVKNANDEDKQKATRVRSTQKDDQEDADENAQEGNNQDYEALREGGGSRNGVIVPDTVEGDQSEREDNSKNRDEDAKEEDAQNHEGVIVPDTVGSEREDNSKNHDEDAKEEDAQNHEGVVVPDTVESEREDNSKNHDEGVIVPDTVGSEREENSKNRDEDVKEENAKHLYSRYIDPKMTKE